MPGPGKHKHPTGNFWRRQERIQKLQQRLSLSFGTIELKKRRADVVRTNSFYEVVFQQDSSK